MPSTNEGENMTEKNDELVEPIIYSDDTVLQKELIGMSLPKETFLDKTEEVKILGLSKNRFEEFELLINWEQKERRLRISKINKNQLIDLLGNSLSDWMNKTVNVTGEVWKGIIDNEEKTGVTLHFS